jgi:DegV family protein with EDD domain
MPKYILLVETGADISDELAAQYHIWRVPMHVSFGAVTRADGSFPVEEIFDHYARTGTLTQTSGCTPTDFANAFDQIRHEYPGAHILHLAYSAATTCSYQNAILAAEGREGITSFDTKHVSAGQALITISLARYLEAHPEAPLDEVLQEAQRLSDRCRMGFFPGDLAYPKAGGRVSNAAYLGAKVLSIDPLIEVRNGQLDVTKKYRGKMARVAPKLLQDFAQQYDLDRSIIAFVYSPGLSQEIKDEVAATAKGLGFQEILWVQTGGVVASHSGPGSFGVSGFARG